MKISRLKLKNIKCFKDIEISFEDNEGSIKNWSLFVGDNGDGKTTILRSLALGLCDKEGASGLLLELHGEYLRRDEGKGAIEIDIKTDSGECYTIQTMLTGENESVSRKILYQDRPVEPGEADRIREHIFAAAYGAGRSITASVSYEDYATVDAVYTLFNYEYALQNPEVVASRVKINSRDQWNKLENTLKKVLMLQEEDKIDLRKKGFFVETSRGEESFNALSDGYKSLTSVILDFLGWNLMYRVDEDFDISNISGIFIIDEIEQHLHPKWQRNIVKILSEQFPNVQFICSTHTPICALGLSDLESGSRLFKAAYVNGHSELEQFDFQEDFKGYRTDQILTSGIFNLTDTRSISVENKLNKYREIYLKEESVRSPEEKERFRAIENELKNLPMWENVIEGQLRKKLIELIESRKEIENNDQD